MHLLDAWTSLPLAALVRWLLMPAALLLATLLPGRRVARLATLVLAAGVLLLEELPGGWPARLVAAAAILVIGRGLGHESAAARPRPGANAVEAGALAFPLTLALVALLFAALSRQPLPPTESRVASLGLLLIGASLLHLLIRRHVRRAVMAFIGFGLGLELLAVAARSLDVTHTGAPAGLGAIGALLAIALVRRIADAREDAAGSPLVPDAHELHD